MLRRIPSDFLRLVPWALLACTPPADVSRSRTTDSAASSATGAEDSPVEAINRSAFAELANCPAIRSVDVPSTRLDTLSMLRCPSKDLGAQPAVAADYYAFRVDRAITVTITMAATETSKTSLDPYLVVYSAAGEKLFQDDTSGGGLGGFDARISQELVAGVYVIEAAASYAGAGPYTLTISAK